MERQEILDAIQARHAVRRYTEQPIAGDVRAALDQEIDRCNRESGLHIQISYDAPEAFGGRISHYGSFEGVHNYLSLIGDEADDLDERCGYWGERIVLLAQHCGLNSCWVALTYSKSKVRAEISPEEKMTLVVALGYGQNQGKAHRGKDALSFGHVAQGQTMPPWFVDGLHAVSLAPSALNQQRFRFDLDGDAVSARAGLGPNTKIDLGIAKYHFEVGAAEGHWHWA